MTDPYLRNDKTEVIFLNYDFLLCDLARVGIRPQFYTSINYNMIPVYASDASFKFLSMIDDLNSIGRTASVFSSHQNNKYSRRLKADIDDTEDIFESFTISPLSTGMNPIETLAYPNRRKHANIIVVSPTVPYEHFVTKLKNIMTESSLDYNIHHLYIEQYDIWSDEQTDSFFELLDKVEMS